MHGYLCIHYETPLNPYPMKKQFMMFGILLGFALVMGACGNSEQAPAEEAPAMEEAAPAEAAPAEAAPAEAAPAEAAPAEGAPAEGGQVTQ